MLVKIEGGTKRYGDKILFKDIDFTLNEKEKIALIGVNGCGKSTLLKIIIQEEFFEEGTVLTHGNISYLSQNPKLEETLTILQQVKKAANLKEEIQEFEAKSILTKLGFRDMNLVINTLSGGQKRRVSLCICLLVDCEILILDEPTNHLDTQMVIWLEKYLIKYNKSIIMITHDRYFLDRVTTKIVEIDNQSLYNYNGNYSFFLQHHDQRILDAKATLRKKKTIYKKELEWMIQGPKARGTKSIERQEKFFKLKEEVKQQKVTNLEIDSVTTRLGTKTYEIENISIGYLDNLLLKDFTYHPLKEDKIGIIGPNGCGKTTLLNVLADKLKPLKGEVIVGETVKLGYFSQESKEMDESLRVIEYIEKFGLYIQTKQGEKTAAQMLQMFLFPPSSHFNFIKTLSGGERRRLYLLGILMESPNVLFLDEPTNDLDIETLLVFEQYLDNFPGLIIAVSHDRYFLDKLVTKIFEYDNQKIIVHNQGYREFFDFRNNQIKATKKIVKQNIKVAPISIAKLTYRETQELKTIDQEIETLEVDIIKIDQLIIKSGQDFNQLNELVANRSLLEEQLDAKFVRWEYLNSFD